MRSTVHLCALKQSSSASPLASVLKEPGSVMEMKTVQTAVMKLMKSAIIIENVMKANSNVTMENASLSFITVMLRMIVVIIVMSLLMSAGTRTVHLYI